jgi:hypothetical protein
LWSKCRIGPFFETGIKSREKEWSSLGNMAVIEKCFESISSVLETQGSQVEESITLRHLWFFPLAKKS